MYTHISSIITVGAALLLWGCAHAGAVETIEPGIRSDSPPPLCAERAGASCASLTRFARKAIASTLFVTVSYRVPGEGQLVRTGTGIAVRHGSRSYVMTVYNLTADAIHMTAEPRELSEDAKSVNRTRVIPMRVIAEIPERDLALLAPMFDDDVLPGPMAIASGVSEDELLWHFGKTSFWQQGAVTDADASTGTWKDVVEAETVCNLGDSGGPFVNSSGELVGILLGGKTSTIGEDPPTYFAPAAASFKALLRIAAATKKP